MGVFVTLFTTKIKHIKYLSTHSLFISKVIFLLFFIYLLNWIIKK